MVVIDFETYYSKEFSLSKITTEEYIRSPQFEIIGVCVKEDDGPIEWITGTNEEIRAALLKHDLSTVVCHNTAFDGAILSWVLDIHPRLLIDTLSMARPIIGAKTGGMVGGSLRALSEHFGIGQKGTEIYNTLGKHLKDFTPGELQRFGAYCVQDVNLTYQLWKKLAPEFPLMETALINITLKMFTEPAIVLDKPLLIDHLAKVKAHKAELLTKVGGLERDVFMSNDKFAQMLRDRGVEPPVKVSPTTGKEAYAFAKTDPGFQALLSHPNEEIQALAAARLGVKTTIEETRTQAFIDVANRGTLPAFLNYYGALNTGRFSGGGGLNVQNLPRGGVLRHSMRAPEGYSIVACDSSQVEARTLAWFAGQDDLTQGFKNNEDIYSKFASEIYGKPINKHDHPEERHVGKTCLAEGTEVLTNHGWKAIETITTDDLLWDGEEWVKHSGVLMNGQKPTLTMCGVSATPDHLCWEGTKFVPWETLVQNGTLFQKALDSVSLPSSASPSTSVTVDEAMAGLPIANAPADGKDAS